MDQPVHQPWQVPQLTTLASLRCRAVGPLSAGMRRYGAECKKTERTFLPWQTSLKRCHGAATPVASSTTGDGRHAAAVIATMEERSVPSRHAFPPSSHGRLGVII